MNAIAVAYEGRIEMLRAIFGGGESKPDAEGPGLSMKLPSENTNPPLTPNAFDAVFASEKIDHG